LLELFALLFVELASPAVALQHFSHKSLLCDRFSASLDLVGSLLLCVLDLRLSRRVNHDDISLGLLLNFVGH